MPPGVPPELLPQAIWLKRVSSYRWDVCPVAGDLRSPFASEHEKSPGITHRDRPGAPPSVGAAPGGAGRGRGPLLRRPDADGPGSLAAALPAVLSRTSPMTESPLFVCTGTCVGRRRALEAPRDGVFSGPRSSSSDR